MELDHPLAPQQHQGQHPLGRGLGVQCAIILGIDIPQRHLQLLAGHERLAIGPTLPVRRPEQRHILLRQVGLHPRLATPQRVLPVCPLRMGAVLPTLDPHALPAIELAQGTCRAGIAALLQAVAEHEERAFKLLPAQVISQQVGTAAIRPGPADEGQQEHAVVQFIPIALA
ncbi:hypothetical protein D3C81_1250470 [compost metagenome]